MFKKLVDFLNEYLRINAMRRLLSVVDIKGVEIAGLSAYAVIFAVFEGVGLSLLLPILQYAEGGKGAILENSGGFWTALAWIMRALNLPVTLPVLLGMAFVPIIMRQAVFYLNAWYSAVVAGRIGMRMRMRTLDTIFDADPEFFNRRPVGDLTGILMSQTRAAGDAVLALMRQLSVALLILLYIAILLVISAPLTLSVVVFSVLVAVTIKANLNRIRDHGVEAATVTQEMTSNIVERFAMIRLVKLRDQKTAESRRIEGYSEIMRDVSVKQARLAANIEVTSDPLLMLSVFFTLYIGITFLGMTLAQLGLLLFILTRLNAKIKEFNSGRQTISANVGGLTLVENTAAEAAAANTIHRGPLVFTGLHQQLVMNDVYFDYEGMPATSTSPVTEATPVLKGVSVTIPAGSLTAVVGRSGAGKSTLVELIPRLRDATSGSITFDGTDIKQFDVGTLRKGIGYLTQSAMLFNDTVRENLVYGLDHEPSEDELAAALESAYATFVYDLPDGLETRLGDRGVRFSGGERQRIGLARVLLEDSSILILDEPTSALDSESESYIQKTLATLHGTKTIIVIAHRLATVIQADQLLVFEDGQIVERGNHADLIAQGGTYHRLFESQLIG